MRVTHNILFNNAVTNLQRQSERFLRTQQEASSGKKVLAPSDDPVHTRRILDLRRSLESLGQFDRNRGTSNTLLQETETALQDVENLLLRARTVTLNAANDTVQPENRIGMAIEISDLFERALQVGNTVINGRHIFAGHDNLQAPFSARATTQSTALPLTTSGTLVAPSANDLTINGLGLRGTLAADDAVSTSDNTASALAIATVINEVSSTTGVSAQAETTLPLTVASYGDLADTDFVINGVAVTGTITDAASLVTAITNANIPGVIASSSGAANLTLAAADGRNIQLTSDGITASPMAFVGFDLNSGTGLDQTATGTVTLTSDTPFTLAGINPGNARFNAGPVNLIGRFTGDDSPIELEINAAQTLPVNVVGPQFLISDLHPDIDRDTPVASLRQGLGISAGSVQITDRVGNTAAIDLSTAITVGDVIDTIAADAGVNVTAAINTAGDGLVITDDNATPTGNLMITNVGVGTTASELGLVLDRPGAAVGAPLRPQLTPATPLSLLHEGRGVSLTSLHIANGAVELDVDLSTAQTIGDVLTTINTASNTAGANVTASINADGTALNIRSRIASTVAIVTEVNGGTTASDLGIQGARDTLKTLSLLQEALQKNDTQALQHVLVSLDESFQQVLRLRADVGARTNRVAFVEDQQAQLELSRTALLSDLEDADVIEVFSRLTLQETAFQAALATTARIIQPTLLDFLR